MFHALRSARHLPRWVLAAFACVMLASGLAPMLASASTPMSEVCSAASGGSHGTLGAEEHAGSGHGLSCALCLPLGLVAPADLGASQTEFPAGRLPAVSSISQPAARVAWRPPTRAPPIPTDEVTS